MVKVVERSPQHETLKRAFLKIEELQQRLEKVEQGARDPIAIIGIACRLPGSIRSLDDYWQLLRTGQHTITDVPAGRWDVEAFYDPNPDATGKMYCRRGSFIDGVDQFDPQFFGITPREVQHMDPQQRILLEVTWEALERAAIAPEALVGSNTAVFTGVGYNDYSRLLGRLDLGEMNAYTGPGTQICFATGRVSYTLGLRGPSVPIDTACSSSLVAVHQACQSLRLGETDLALAGGVNLVLVPEGNVWLSRAGALAPDGLCKTFDAGANGFVRGEGCAVLVLKRLRDALRDGNSVLALIRGSAVNHDGRSSGLTVPSALAQEALLRQALANAGVRPEQVSYLEAHGTGTSLGDPIEMRAIAATYGTGRRLPLTVGSVKTNLGHLEAASGVAGLIKVVLMLRNRQIPPHLHFKALSPMIALDGLDVQIPTELRAWDVQASQSRVAGVSSFGLSGTNAHVLLEEATTVALDEPVHAVADAAASGPVLLPISAQKPEALTALVRSYRDLLLSAGDGELSDIGRTAAIGRNHFDHRLALTARTSREASEALSAYLRGEPSRLLVSGRRPLTGTAKLAFAFAGEGQVESGAIQAAGAQLFEREQAFREAFRACDVLFARRGYSSLEAALDATGRTAVGDLSLPLLFAFQVGLASLWRHWGIQPDGVVGIGVGEIAAAHLADALTLEDAVALVDELCRSRLMSASEHTKLPMPRCTPTPRVASLPMCSTVTGAVCQGSELDPAHWERNLAERPALTPALEALVSDEFESFLEMGPESRFSLLMREGLEHLAAQRRERSLRALPGVDPEGLRWTLAQLYCLGHSPDWRRVYPAGRLLPNLPVYPWQHQRYWIDAEASRQVSRANGHKHPVLGYAVPSPAARPEIASWEIELGPEATSLAPLQVIAGRNVLSTATLTRWALAAAKQVLKAELPAITSLEVHRPLAFAANARCVVQVSVSPDELGQQIFHVHSRSGNSSASDLEWVLHASAKLARA